MSRSKPNVNVCFIDQDEIIRAVVRVINIGKSTDEFKFVFVAPKDDISSLYIDKPNQFSHDDVLAPYHEVTYHSSGTLMYKMIGIDGKSAFTHRNPFGKGFMHKPLDQIREWRLFLRYKVFSYQL